MSARTDAAASLVELVHSRLAKMAGWEAESKALERALQMLVQSDNARRQKAHRERKRNVTNNVTSNVTNNAEVTQHAPSRALPSESCSSIPSVSYADLQTSESESEKRASERDDRNAFVTPKVTANVTLKVTPDLDRVAGVLNGAGTVGLSRPDLERLTALLPTMVAEARKQNVSVDLMIAKAWKRFRNDPGIRSKSGLARIGVFLGQWDTWLEDGPQRGIAPVSSIEEFEREARDRAAREQRA